MKIKNDIDLIYTILRYFVYGSYKCYKQKEMLYRNVINNVSFPHVHFLTQPQIDRSTAPAAYNNLALL